MWASCLLLAFPPWTICPQSDIFVAISFLSPGNTVMRRALLELMACPHCQGAIELLEVHEENAVRVLRGTLLCTSCDRRYSIEKGVPRLVKATDDVTEICRRFSIQW